jgi:hypothetical protein
VRKIWNVLSFRQRLLLPIALIILSAWVGRCRTALTASSNSHAKTSAPSCAAASRSVATQTFAGPKREQNRRFMHHSSLAA